MKKIILFLLCFLFFPITIFAIDYDIEHFYIDATVLSNGDMDVSELIVLDGSFNGYERDLIYYNALASSELNASSIENIEVYGKHVDSVSFDTFNEWFDTFTPTNYATNGESSKYILSSISGGKRIRMYYYTVDEATAFLIKYTIKDVVVLHDDFAEIYWNFIGDDFADQINDLKIRVTLPGLDESNYYRIWAHGSLTGEINFDNTSTNSRMLASVSEVEPYEPVDIRSTFSKDLITSANKSSTKTFEGIIAEETEKADEANALRENIKKIYYGSVVGLVIFYLYTIISFIYVYIKYDKERKPQFNLEYNREFIDDYNVEVVDYLMNRGITSNAMSASIMNLIYKKNIKAEALDDKKKDYKFTLLNRDNLNETENALVDFLFNKVGNNDSFTTMALKNYASSTKTCKTFMNTYTNWKNMAEKDGESQGFFETKKGYIWFSLISLIYSILFMIITVNLNVDDSVISILRIVNIIIAVIYLIYTLTFSKKTKKGIEHYAKWKAFKKFLEDFGTFELKELPEIILWERYLVYATVFGLADKVSKTMNVRIEEMDATGLYPGTYTFHDYWFDMNLARIINMSINNAISSSNTSIARVNAQNASSSHSNGSGFGGGFSGGGGFGGGGGGGRGF